MWGSTNQLNIQFLKIEYVNIWPSTYLILLLFNIEILLSIYQINLVQRRLRFQNRNLINTRPYVSIQLPINTDTIVIRILDLLNPSSCEPVSIQ